MARLAKERYLVLMVDDCADDCLLIRLAIGKAERLHFIGSVPDGEEVLDYLNGAGKYEDREQYPLPDVLLLDLRMPRKDGFEVLEWLQTQPFDDMVVVVLSGTTRADDVRKAIQMGAHLYHPKQADGERRTALIKLIEDYITQRGRE
jgi:CheY-like chemotaxis protein